MKKPFIFFLLFSFLQLEAMNEGPPPMPKPTDVAAQPSMPTPQAASEKTTGPEKQPSAAAPAMPGVEKTPDVSKTSASQMPASADTSQAPAMPMPTTSSAEPEMPASATTESAPTPTPSQPAAPSVEFEQPKWPQAVELTEQTSGIIPPGKEEDFSKLLDEAKSITDQMREIISQIRKQKDVFYNRYKQIETKLDSFFQETSFKQGELLKEIQAFLEQKPANYEQLVAYKSEVEQNKSEMESIDQLEIQVLDKLKELDLKIDQALDQSMASRKLSTNVNALNETVLDSLKNNLEKINQIKQFIDADFSNKFNEMINQLDSRITQVEQGMKTLEQKKEALGLVEKEIEAEKTVAKKKIKDVKRSAFFNYSVKTVAGTINLFRNIGTWFKDVFKEGIEQSKDKKSSKEKTVVSKAEPVKEPLPKPQVAEMPTASIAKTSYATTTTDVALQNIQKQMEALEESMGKLAEEKKEIEKRREEIDQMKKERIDQLKKKLEMIEKMDVEFSSPKTAKQKTLSVVGQIWDGAAFVGRKAKNYSVAVYNRFFRKTFQDFAAAVRRRVEQIEKREQGKDVVAEVLVEEVVTENVQQESSPAMPIPEPQAPPTMPIAPEAEGIAMPPAMPSS